MLESVQDACRLGIESYGGRPREAWVLEWPGQVVLVGSAIFWTAEVSASLSSKQTGVRFVAVVDSYSNIEYLISASEGIDTDSRRVSSCWHICQCHQVEYQAWQHSTIGPKQLHFDAGLDILQCLMLWACGLILACIAAACKAKLMHRRLCYWCLPI